VVSPYEEQFRETFESHEHLAPDMGAVYNGSQVLFRRYLRRRRGAQVVGGAVLGAGLLAGTTNLPAGLLPGATVAVPTIGTGTPPAVPSSVPTALSQAELGRDLDAYDRAGYGYDDAVQLAAIWHTTVNVGFVKAEAGRQLLTGRTLPIPPHADPSDPSEPSGPVTPDRDAAAATAAFAAAGYNYDDAVRLAGVWKLAGPGDAKIMAGKKIEAGQPLPFRAVSDDAALRKYWAEGYDSFDGAKLARLWHVTVDQAKVEAGQKLLAGEPLPIRP
jgi:hypothetical protein